jgi:hypothetical protein
LEKVSEDVPQNTMGNESLSNNAPVQSGLEVADDLPF